MRSFLLTLLCFAALLGGSGLVQPARAAEQSEEDRISDQAMNALWWADFDELERQHTLFQQPGQRTASGRAKLSFFRNGIDRVLKGPTSADDAYFVQVEALTLQWAQAHPESALAHVLHANALLEHAWSYRGGGYANTVPPNAWADFSRYIDKAVNYLAAHQRAAMKSSSAYVDLLNLGRAASWGADMLWPMMQAGAALNADDDSVYRAMVNATLPKWGGNAALVDRVIQDIAKTTASRHGDMYYAQLYALATDAEYAAGVFNDSGASWPRMKASYEQLMTKYPSDANLNAFARFACLAQDKATFLDLLQKIGNKPQLDAWGVNGSRSYETCKRWASQL